MPLDTQLREELDSIVDRSIADCLAVSKDKIKPETHLREDLGIESLDVLDLTFRFERDVNALLAKRGINNQFLIRTGGLLEDLADGSLTPEEQQSIRKGIPIDILETAGNRSYDPISAGNMSSRPFSVARCKEILAMRVNELVHEVEAVQ